MSQTNEPHSNPLSRMFSKIFHHDDAAKTSQAASHPASTTPAATPHPQPGLQSTAPRTVTPSTGTAGSPVASTAGTTASATPVSTPTTTRRTYTVMPGDSLSKIAQHQYGHADQWKVIFEANRDTISNPDLIHPGQVLVIPEAPTRH